MTGFCFPPFLYLFLSRIEHLFLFSLPKAFG
jgi:hypothetical protein